MTGKKSPPKEVLLFATNAIKVTKIELNLLINSYPSDLVNIINNKLLAETNI